METAFEIYNMQSLAQTWEEHEKGIRDRASLSWAVRRSSTRRRSRRCIPAGGGLPKGQIFHAAGASAGGWTIVAVHDSKESWERFRDGILMPRMKQGIKGGFASATTGDGL